MKSVFIIVILTFPIALLCQKDQAEEVKAVVENLFTGMYKGDSSMVHSCFSDDVRMYTTLMDDKEKDQLRRGDLVRFLNAVGTPHNDVWDEKKQYGLHARDSVGSRDLRMRCESGRIRRSC